MVSLDWVLTGRMLAVVFNAEGQKDICDMIKGNDSDVTDIVFEILAKEEVKFFCFILFSVKLRKKTNLVVRQNLWASVS